MRAIVRHGRSALLLGLAALWVAGAANAGPCDLLGGDGDGDGICDDGSGSGVVGDLPCSCPAGAPPACDDVCDDNCPWEPNPDQLDVGRFGDPDLPDGIGDACQCYDVSDDGRGNVLDSVLYHRVLGSLEPPLADPRKCPGAGAASCDAADIGPLRAGLASPTPPPANVCLASGACTASADCPAGIACDLAAQRCEKNAGQACVEGSQCLTGACCAQLCRDLSADVANCGACGLTCQNPNGETGCVAGQCAPSCASGFGSCDGNLVNGCEQSLTTVAHCGGCNVPCALANATETCATGQCALASCEPGFSNCDASETTGCEVGHASVTGVCGSGTGPSYDGDRACGFVCGSNTGWDTFATNSGNASGWFRAHAREDSDCATDIEHRIQLTVPPGVDYDLHAWRNCTSPVASSTSGPGMPEQVIVFDAENNGSDDSFDYWVEVRYVSGASCANWTLTFAGHDC